ncbi:MAG: saccharopine dehydrogenase [bacterium]|nr:saccharopine dehydrogenase [bacterium]
MKLFCLGGAGKICREAALDAVEFSDFEEILIGDVNEAAGCEAVEWLNDPRVRYERADIHDHDATVKLLSGFDVVMDGSTISLNGRSTACIAEAGAHGVNLNGFGEEYAYHEQFKRNGRVFVPGFGMTPGTTNMMAVLAANQMDSVDTVRVSHGAFRPIAFSASIAETTTYEYDPALPGRVVYEDGEFVQVPPFARPLDIELPEPYGTHTQYIIPHSETRTLAEYLKPKGVRLIEVRGTWPPQNMRMVRALYEYGFMRNDAIEVNGATIGILDAVARYLIQSEEGRTTELYGYALHVDVTGMKDGRPVRRVLTHTHPASDGSEPGWEKLRAYTRCVGIPMSIGAQLIAKGKAKGAGALIPERVFDPQDVFDELKKRRILIHETLESPK